MWRKLQECPPYFIKTAREYSLEVYVTNYITIWFVNHSNESFAACLQDSNIDLEIETNELITRGLDLLLNPTGLSNVIITKGQSSLEVSMTKLFEYPIRLELKLLQGSREMFTLNVTQVLVRTDVDLETSWLELSDLLKKKNNEIKEFKHVKNQIEVCYLKSERLNDVENQVSKENKELVVTNILQEGTPTLENRNIKEEPSEVIQIKVEHETSPEREPQSTASSSNMHMFEAGFSSNSETSRDTDSELSSASDYVQASDSCRRSLNRAPVYTRRESPLRTTSYDEPQETIASNSQGMQQQPMAKTNTEFNWTSEWPRNKKTLDFSDKTSGISQDSNLDVNSPELAFFEHFLDDHLVQQIVNFTNRYQKCFVSRTPLSKHSRLSLWKEVTVPEMYLFIAITMLMTRNKHLSIEEHWSTDTLLSCPIFSNVMPRNRYCMILGMLSFCEPGSCNMNDSRLHKLRLMIDHTRDKFKKTFIPYCDLCIHDNVLPFKGRLGHKRNLVTRNRFGMKLFLLCDVKTNYILDFIVYCGSTSVSEIDYSEELGVTGTIVKSLLKDYFGTNRKLYTNECYTSPCLYKTLLDNGIYACGMVNRRRAGMPTFNALQYGELEAKCSQGLLALKWCNQKDNYMLSSWHDSSMKPTPKLCQRTGSLGMKPACFIDYIRNTKSADNSDVMMSSLQCIRKTVKWYKKLALHVMDMQLLNAFYAYKTVTQRKCQLSQFHLTVIRQIIQKYKGEIKIKTTNNNYRVSHNAGNHTQSGESRQENPLRILPGNSAEHMPKYIANKKSLRCKVCAIQKRRKDTRFFCSVCQVSLCVVPCFQNYHQNS